MRRIWLQGSGDDAWIWRLSTGIWAVCDRCVFGDGNDPELGPLATTVNSFLVGLSGSRPCAVEYPKFSDHLASIPSVSILASASSRRAGGAVRAVCGAGGHNALPEHFYRFAGEPKLIDALAHFCCARMRSIPAATTNYRW